MNLCIDAGNTRVKAAVFDGRQLVAEGSVEELLAEYSVTASILCSVRGEVELPDVPDLLVLDYRTPVPLVNRYATVGTLGMDRLAAAVGAAVLCPARNVMVVDLGTAITIDLVSAAGEFVGGNISAGLKMRLEALHEKTSRLPLVDRQETGDRRQLLADNTRDALWLGAVNGIAYEIEGYREALRNRFGAIEVILTGGDAQLFEKRIKNTIFAGCNVLMTGLNAILELRIENEERP